MKIIETDNGFEVRTNKGRMSRAYGLDPTWNAVIHADSYRPMQRIKLFTSNERAITALLEHRLNEEFRYAKFS